MSLYLENDSNIIKREPFDIIFKEGDSLEGFYIVLEGSVICIKENNKRLVPVFCAKNQDFIAEDCVLLKKDTYSYSAIAYEQCQLIFIPKVDVENFLTYKNDWISDILSSIALKISNTSDLISEHRINDDRINPFDDFDELENKIRKILNNN